MSDPLLDFAHLTADQLRARLGEYREAFASICALSSDNWDNNPTTAVHSVRDLVRRCQDGLNATASLQARAQALEDIGELIGVEWDGDASIPAIVEGVKAKVSPMADAVAIGIHNDLASQVAVLIGLPHQSSPVAVLKRILGDLRADHYLDLTAKLQAVLDEAGIVGSDWDLETRLRLLCDDWRSSQVRRHTPVPDAPAPVPAPEPTFTAYQVTALIKCFADVADHMAGRPVDTEPKYAST